MRAVLWQKLEGLVVFAAGIALFLQWNESLLWWAAILVFFAPDLTFAGYAFGPKIGASIYNVVHVYAFGAALIALGIVLAHPLLAALGALWLAHSGFDRMLGYGLKSPEGFAFTHLGNIGKQR